MKIETACKNYFNSIAILKNPKNYSSGKKALAGLAVASWFASLGLLPLIVGGTYLLAKSCSKITKKNPTDQKVSSVSSVVLETPRKLEGLERIGGFERGNNNTCFLATTLQSLRQVP